MGTALLSIGVRAMAASYAQMQTTGHNIANASVEGYSRQQVNLATARGQYTGVGYFGRGVDVVGVQRMQDQFLTNEAARSKSLASMDAVRSARLQQLQEAFKGGEQGIGAAITNLFAAYSDLASRPTDGASRGVVLARAQDVARRFNTAGEQMATLQTTVNQELQAAVTAVNTIAASIAKVNNDVAAARGSGQMPNDLLDQRDRLISQLSEYVSVSTIEADDGTLGVFMGGGQRLVLGVQAERLEVTPDTFDGSRKSVTISEGAVQRSLTADSLGGGSIPGLLKFQNEDLVSAQSMLGQLARALAGAVNDQQERGLDLAGHFGQKLFDFDRSTQGLQGLPANTNAVMGQVSVEVTHASELRGREYELRIDGTDPSKGQLIRVPDDGTVINVDDGVEVPGEGFVIHFDSGIIPGDRYRLQPTALAAMGMRVNISNPADLAAASPLVGAAASANTGTLTVEALRMQSLPVDATATTSITFGAATAAGTPYTWTMVGTSGTTTGTGLWTPGQPLPSPPDPDINGFQLDLAGVPHSGDTLEVGPPTSASTNNGNALALQRLGTLRLVGLEDDGSGGLSFTEAYIADMSDVGVRAQGAVATAAISDARFTQAESARADRAGVNLDEEAARLIQYQQSYQAAAKVLQIAQQVFSQLLDIAG